MASRRVACWAGATLLLLVVSLPLSYIVTDHAKGYTIADNMYPSSPMGISTRNRYQRNVATCDDTNSNVTLTKQRVSSDEMTCDLAYVDLATVVCGDRVSEALVMMKSALTLTQAVHFHLFADARARTRLKQKVSSWPSALQACVRVNTYDIQYPGTERSEEWSRMVPTCATQRLFLPDILTRLDTVIYVDTDVLFMRPLVDLWQHFLRFNSSQVAALAREHEDALLGWYPRFSRVPYYPPSGLNSGIILMNLTRMREACWGRHVVTFYKQYKEKLIWSDQDLINIYFSYFSEQLFVLACTWNFRADMWSYGISCGMQQTGGASVLHGNRRVFHGNTQPAFRAMFDVYLQYSFGEDLETSLLQPILSRLSRLLEPERRRQVTSQLTHQIRARAKD